MIKNLLCWILLAFVVVSCDKSYVTPDPVARGLNFYPLEVGDYRIYDVTDIKYQHNVPTELNFQMREWVADSFMDQTNTLTYKIIRSIRANAESEWEDDSVMTVTKNHNMVTLTKDNTKYVKMVFPVEEGKTWHHDAFNDRYDSDLTDKELSTYVDLDQPFSHADLQFDQTLTVLQQGIFVSPSLGKDERKEVYARNVGLIYRLFNRQKYEPCSDCPDETEPYILDGHERHEVLIEHGKL
ncbi:hypothetical protein [Pontibacter populi]|uniref:DUF4136 domain-containing protein n=1 Tax=Pontibacter populi TaxID=890055 RepID=A0ABV1RVJ5_9BACT